MASMAAFEEKVSTLGRLFFCRPQPMGSNINPVMSCIAASAVDRQTLTRGDAHW